MRQQLGNYLFVGSGALILGSLSAIFNLEGFWVLTVLGVALAMIVAALILKPWKPSADALRAKKLENLALADAKERELEDLGVELAELRQKEIVLSRLPDVSTLPSGNAAYRARQDEVVTVRSRQEMIRGRMRRLRTQINVYQED